jgi:hypothetical protein
MEGKAEKKGFDRQDLLQVIGVHGLDGLVSRVQPVRAFERRHETAESIPFLERFGQPLKDCDLALTAATFAGTKRDETEKVRNAQPLAPIFLRFSDFQQMRNRCISRAMAVFLMAEAVPQQRICRFTVP